MRRGLCGPVASGFPTLAAGPRGRADMEPADEGAKAGAGRIARALDGRALMLLPLNASNVGREGAIGISQITWRALPPPPPPGQVQQVSENDYPSAGSIIFAALNQEAAERRSVERQLLLTLHEQALWKRQRTG